ncbi:GH92 family glycosyl hydrolase [Proteiniphilum sp.]|uniref:GH92 family glycosyl hydrolase n=1 Tax=Proteiniphilum sp. TaxID=1926877 RepID=UPI002B1FAD8E|nr:GH92 family glycosyl hydrolase [Proteiniphilum sp.]MEA4916868.1 GH92 family glycosyl hydrolase [Proteiniphilum sp.]
MKKISLLLLISLISSISSSGQAVSTQKEPVDYVDCFIGTSNSRWMLGPYAQLPFGMVQIGPDNQGNRWMGGYEYAINSISGFSHIHAWTMGGLMMMPTTADLAISNPGPDAPYKGANAGYHSRILKETEKAFPGYYEVELYDHKVKASMTASTRCSFQRYVYPKASESRIMIDLHFPTEWDYGFTVEDAVISMVNDKEIEGYAKCKSGAWSSWNDWTLFFVIKLDKPIETFNGWHNGHISENIKDIKGNNDIGAFVTFTTAEGEEVLIQTGLSLVSIEGARKNLNEEIEIPFGWNFDAAVTNARKVWNDLLGKVKVEGGTEINKTKFYTNLYRSFSGKQTWNDVDGRYRDACEEIQQLAEGQSVYGGDAFWNSYWNLNGLWSLITPKIMDNWVTTQLEMYRHTGWTSKGPAGIEYSGIMEGSHEIALMVAAYQKGIRKDGEAIYEAVRKMVFNPGGSHPCGGNYGQLNLGYYTKLGYMPREVDVVSKTLDYAYDDYCVAQLAKALHRKKDAAVLEKRAMNYRNVFHPDQKYVCRRDSLGNWDPEFDIFSNQGFIEGNSWQYSWYVPHDVPGLLDLIGRDKAKQRLKDGFRKSEEHNFAAHIFDRTMGQSAEFYINHGNEVNMSAAYIFNYLGEPALCQQYTREILDRYYGATPYHGWEGDEDEGQMGAWFVMTAIGLFEMNGGVTANSEFDITTPLFEKITISLDGDYYPGNKFTIETKNYSGENKYIQAAYLNGKRLKRPEILFSDIVKGGTLILEAGDKPNDKAF